jgi:hypothetical protein
MRLGAAEALALVALVVRMLSMRRELDGFSFIDARIV